MTAAGVAGVRADDAGAASGLVNVAHQLGGSLGLGILVAVSASAVGATTLDARALLAERAATALSTGAVLLVLALVLVVTLIVRPWRAPVPTVPAVPQPVR
jgi:hypothetical protein